MSATALFCGHVHQAQHGALVAVPVWTTPPVAYQFRPQSRWPSLAAAGPGYRIVELDGERCATSVVRDDRAHPR